MGSTSENTPSESAMTSDDETKPHLPSSNLGFDYVEPVESGSSVSTPPTSSLPDDEPFASDNLGDTVIKLDKVGKHERGHSLAHSQLIFRAPALTHLQYYKA